jgi:hypothetical protein
MNLFRSASQPRPINDLGMLALHEDGLEFYYLPDARAKWQSVFMAALAIGWLATIVVWIATMQHLILRRPDLVFSAALLTLMSLGALPRSWFEYRAMSRWAGSSLAYRDGHWDVWSSRGATEELSDPQIVAFQNCTAMDIRRSYRLKADPCCVLEIVTAQRRMVVCALQSRQEFEALLNRIETIPGLICHRDTRLRRYFRYSLKRQLCDCNRSATRDSFDNAPRR